jgi:pimeloyl-ACP methyl ester carboxylesterase
VADAGFHVVAIDQRGYNLSDKPAAVASYDLDLLCDDVLGIADALGQKTFNIVGHDWGAIIAWWLAARNPDRIERMAVLNASHPSIWREAIKNHRAQRRKSWYVGVLQWPKFPEWLMRQRNFDALAKALKSSSRADAFSETDLQLYRGAWQQSGALTAMVDWYRAIAHKTLPAASSVRIDVPTMILWGVNDAYAIRELAERAKAMCSNARLEYFENATHWVQHDEPERVSKLLINFFRE